MYHLVFVTIVVTFKQCSSQLGYGGSSYCSSCALGSSGSISRGFGFGGGNYVGSSNTANSGTTSQSLYSLPASSAFVIPSSNSGNSYIYGSNEYGSAGYGSSHSGNTVNYGTPSTTGMTWKNAYGSTGNYGTESGYFSCYNNNCLPSTGYSTLSTSSAGSGADYGISNSNAISYSSLPDASYKTYSLPSAHSVYSTNLGVPGDYITTSHLGLPAAYSLPATYSSYPVVYGVYGNQGSSSSSSNALKNLLSFSTATEARKH